MAKTAFGDRPTFMPKKNIYSIIISAVAAFVIIVVVSLFANYINQKNLLIRNQTGINHPAPQNNQPNPSAPQNAVKPNAKIAVPVSPLDFAEKSGQAGDCLKSSSESYKNSCITLLAQYLQSSTTCLNLKSQADQAKCADQANYEKAIKNNRMSVCLSIRSDELILSCVQGIISQIGAKPGDCDALPNKERKYCLDFLAYAADQDALKSAKSRTDCQRISDIFLNSVCLGKFPQ
jgi:hypothetical protein